MRGKVNGEETERFSQALRADHSTKTNQDTAPEMLQKHQSDLIEDSMASGALIYGSFVLKSGRISPYFFNAGLICSGKMLSSLAAGYAALIASSLSSSDFPQFDILFGPAYKGISLAACTALVLHRDYNIDVGFGYDRKEAKDHGEGGNMVGAPVAGKKILVLDDVMTAGTAARGAVDMIRKAGGDVVGVALCLDRDEVGKGGRSSVQEMEEYVGGKGRVKAIIKMGDLMAWLEQNGKRDELRQMQKYWEEFGVKR